MKSIKYQSRLCKSGAAFFGFNLRGLKIVTVICFAIILSICNSAYGRKDLKCGDEIRVETRDGTLIKGKLRMNQDGLLKLSQGKYSSKFQTIASTDVKTIYRIRRATLGGTVFFMFTGATAGLMIVRSLGPIERAGLFEGLDDEIWRGVAITAGGTIIGGILGYIIGHNIQRLHEIQIEAKPQCFSASGDKFLLKVNLAIGS